MNYRKFYKDYYNIEFGTDYVVHHIDFNRENNNIDNLILLPKKLHSKYHILLNRLGVKNVDEMTVSIGINLHTSMHTAPLLIMLGETLQEIKGWILYKQKLELNKISKL